MSKRMVWVSAFALLSLLMVGVGHAQLSFTDQTVESGLGVIHVPAVPALGIPMLVGGGVGDFNSDGFQDVFVAMGGGARDCLFINLKNGTFEERASWWEVDHAHVGGGVAVADYDDDGRLDMFVASHGLHAELLPGQHRLYRNTGIAFENVAKAAGVDTTSEVDADGYGAAFGDMDLDGDLDLFVAGWVENSGGNRLFENLGDGTFTDVTLTKIEGDLTAVRGFSPNFVDMDGDMYPEMLLAADFGTSRYLVNDGDGTFTDITAASGTGLDSNGMGQTTGDLDGDGLLDWYVTSIHSEIVKEIYSGNMLYRNLGGNTFEEISIDVGVNDGGFGWGTVAVDIDHDGDVDLVENNGWEAQTNEWLDEQSYVYLNDGGAVSFTESALLVGMSNVGDGRGVMRLDIENDGDQDLVFLHHAGPVTFFRNDLAGPGTHWLRVFLGTDDQQGVSPDGYGSMVRATAGGTTQLAAISNNTPYLTQSELSAHFGLGGNSLVEQLEVRWTDGTVTYLTDVPANQSVLVRCCSGWKDLGSGLGGSAGVPDYQGSGELSAGKTITFTLTDALANAQVHHVTGLSELSAPFKGGVLVPSPDYITPGYLTDEYGTLQIEAVVPDLPADVEVWYQMWIVDPAAPKGLAASNGLKATYS